MEVPIQYRLVYLLMFLFVHQNLKVIVFASNCEVVNYLSKCLKEINWNKCVNKRGKTDGSGTVDFEKEEVDSRPPNHLFGGHIYKLHGDMDHADRK